MPSRLRRTQLLCLSMMALPALSQTPAPAAKRPAFEVATIKPSTPADRAIAILTYPGGRVAATQYTLGMLVEEAFNVQHFQVTGGPSWIQQDRFNLIAQPPAGSPASLANPPAPKFPMNDDQRLMLQSLLIERFGLKFHIEDRDGPVYLLTRGTKPLDMTSPRDPVGLPYVLGFRRQGGFVTGEMEAENVSMPFLAMRLSSYLERPVLDQTGLTGAYDLHLAAVDPENTDVVGGIVSSVDRLGLKLEGGRGPVHTVVIDAATHPTAN